MNIRPTPPKAQIPFKHAQCLLSRFHHKCLHGGRNGAKSWSAATYVIGRSRAKKELIVCFRQHQNALRDSSKALIENRIHDLGLDAEFWTTNAFIRHIATGSEFLFLGLERSIDSIKSLEGASIVWIEEAQTISEESIEILLPTIRAEGAEFIWTWNPRSPSDPVDKMFRGPIPRPDAMAVEVNFWDHDFVSAAARTEMDIMRDNNFARFEHIYCGKYEARSITKVFASDKVIIGRPPDADLTDAIVLFGLDFGWSDPSACVAACFIPRTRTIYVMKEAFSRGVSLDDLPAFVDSVVPSRRELIWCDSARPDIIDLLTMRGFNVRGADKGPNSKRAGVQRLQNYTLILDPACENARREVHGYSWRTNKLTGEVIEGAPPVDGDDHIIDALRYCTNDVLNDDDGGEERWHNGGVFRIPMWKRRW
jgi:phage terminase large subunit